ncbi:major facilitator superfamily domain-containing protein [Nemania serpens]|nr:major facilitator superfamily domain-containing protein [Nemania serpens]
MEAPLEHAESTPSPAISTRPDYGTPDSDDHDSESARLLSPSPERDASIDNTTSPLDDDERATPQDDSAPPPYSYTVALIFGLVLVAGVSSSLLNAPEVRLLEMALCRDYYRANDSSVIGPPPLSYVDEQLCKVDSIQADLAYIMATRSLLSAIPGLLLTFPYGQLANKIGRKPVLFLGLLGETLAYFWVVLVCYFHDIFPTRLVLLSPVFVVIGGGSKVVSASMYTIITDVTPEHNRTTIFYLTGAGLLSTALLSTPLGSFLLSIDLWLPYKVNTPVLLLSFPLVLAIPETLKRLGVEDSSGQESIGVAKRRLPMIRRFSAKFISWVRGMKQSLSALNPSAVRKEIIMVLVLLFLAMFCAMTGRIFVQYTSKLLGWPISTTGYILSVRAFVSLVVLFGLAALTRFVDKWGKVKSITLDIWIVRLSFAALVVGTVFIAMSSGPGLLITGSILTCLGNGLAPALLGILTHFADTYSTSQTFASAALVELLAEFVGGFAFAGLFEVGMKERQSLGIGLPFYVSAALTAIAGVLSLLLPTDR